MFGWLRKRQDSPSEASLAPVDDLIRAGVDKMVMFLRVSPASDDDFLVRLLADSTLSESQAVGIVQFVPIAFTRFLYRDQGVRFAPNYIVLGANGKPVAERPVAAEPAFRAAWEHCEQAAARGMSDEYFVRIAQRSAGHKTIQELLQKGAKLASIVTGPPMMTE